MTILAICASATFTQGQTIPDRVLPGDLWKYISRASIFYENHTGDCVVHVIGKDEITQEFLREKGGYFEKVDFGFGQPYLVKRISYDPGFKDLTIDLKSREDCKVCRVGTFRYDISTGEIFHVGQDGVFVK